VLVAMVAGGSDRNTLSATIMAKHLSLICYLKKQHLKKKTPLPSSTESTQPSSSDSLTHKKAIQVLAVAASCSLSPGQPDAGLPADLTAILLF